MKNKIFLLIIFSLLLSNYVYKTIWNFKYNNISQKEIPYENNLKKHGLKGEIIKNNFTEIIINKGTSHNLKINMICEGEKGFIGLISEVHKDYSVVKTLWYINWQLIVIDGNNNYGYLNSNGYFLYVSTSLYSHNKFEDNNPVYIISNKEKSLIGHTKHVKQNIYKIIPEENILKCKNVYIK